MRELVSLLTDTQAVEYAEARRTHQLSNAADWTLVFFTLEGFAGTNSYTFYLAVFEPNFGSDGTETEAGNRDPAKVRKYRLVGYAPVGGKGWRHLDFSDLEVASDAITLQTTEYKDSDPMSTPSKPGRAFFKVQNRQVVEVLPSCQPPSSTRQAPTPAK